MNNILILLAAILGTIGSYWVSIKLDKGAVMGSAIVVLISGIIFPYISSEIGSTLAVVATTGSYAGMISKKNAPNVWETVTIGLIVGVVFILATSTYVGVGGKLGTMAAISCFIWLGIKKTFKIYVFRHIVSTRQMRGTNIGQRNSQSY